jgi:hypothetical protein
MCCHWRTKPDECGIGNMQGPFVERGMPMAVSRGLSLHWTRLDATEWVKAVQTGSILPRSGSRSTRSNNRKHGYLGAFVPRSLPGSSGRPVCDQNRR